MSKLSSSLDHSGVLIYRVWLVLASRTEKFLPWRSQSDNLVIKHALCILQDVLFSLFEAADESSN